MLPKIIQVGFKVYLSSCMCADVVGDLTALTAEAQRNATPQWINDVAVYLIFFFFNGRGNPQAKPFGNSPEVFFFPS